MRKKIYSILFLMSVGIPVGFAACEQHPCVMVIDAGSSGSRAHLYEYEKAEGNVPSVIQELWSKKVNPGFSTLEARPEVIHQYIEQLLTGMPVAEKVPVYFYATAGMRLLPEASQQALYRVLKKEFKERSFAGQKSLSLVRAKTISGSDEGWFAWLTVNYQRGTFNAQSQGSAGIMDIGGASTQIAFEVNPSMQSQSAAPMHELDTPSHHFTVSSTSFLGLGQNQVLNQILDEPTCFSEGYPLSNGQQGQGDAAACAEHLRPLLNMHKVSQTISLSQSQASEWQMLGGASYFAQSPALQPYGYVWSSQALLNATQRHFCQSSWDSISMTDPKNTYLYAHCALGSYYYSLLVNGYGFAGSETMTYYEQKYTGDWTLGVVFEL
ncbi:MAG: multidrug DMT transporter permease [Legionellaceae bacterium]|nr:multidrug DMT transporter permease [Legionellaceae bacterium]